MADEAKQKVTMQELEAETGLEGNTDASESDAVHGVADGTPLDEIEQETTERHGIETVPSEVSDAISREQAFEGMDDNVEIMEAELAREEEGGTGELEEELDERIGRQDDDAEELEEDEGDEDAPEEDEAAEGEDEEAEDEEAAAASGDEDEEEAEEEGAGDEDLDPMRSWVRENLTDEADQQALVEALMEEGAKVPLKSHGKTEMVTLKEMQERAAGYAGQEVVDRRMAEAKQAIGKVKEWEEGLQAEQERFKDVLKTFNDTVNDPEELGNMIRQSADLDYLRKLHGMLDQELMKAESDPDQWEFRREFRSMKGMLEEVRQEIHGNGRRGTGTPDEGAGRETSPEPEGTGSDWGFTRGVGYPENQTVNAKREVVRALEAARAVDDSLSVTYQDAVNAWNAEGRKRTIYDVAKALIARDRRDRQKRSFDADPPTRRQTGKGRARSGDKKPKEKRRSKPVAWDDIPGQIVKELTS